MQGFRAAQPAPFAGGAHLLREQRAPVLAGQQRADGRQRGVRAVPQVHKVLDHVRQARQAALRRALPQPPSRLGVQAAQVPGLRLDAPAHERAEHAAHQHVLRAARDLIQEVGGQARQQQALQARALGVRPAAAPGF